MPPYNTRQIDFCNQVAEAADNPRDLIIIFRDVTEASKAVLHFLTSFPPKD